MKQFAILIAALFGHHLSCKQAAALAPCEQLEASVHPCTCDGAALDCSAVSSGAELLAIPGLQSGQSIEFDYIGITENNVIVNIPDGAFGNHYAADEYRFSFNSRLTSIGRSVFLAPNATSSVQHIGVADNPLLETFPFDDLRAFASVKVIDLSWNRLKGIPARAFEGLPALTTILLYQNRIRSIGSNAFNNLPSLTTLILDQNHLTSMSADWFNFSDSPANVVLASNFIRKVEGNFSRFPVTTILWGNQIETLEQEVWDPVFAGFEESDELEDVHFGENPFICDCRMKWLRGNQAFQKYTSTIRCTNGPTSWTEFWALPEDFFADC